MTGAKLDGGIATTNLNILHALRSLVEEGVISLSVVDFLEEPDARPDLLPASAGFRACGGSKLRMALATLRAAAVRPLCLIDHVGLALPLLPLARVGFVATVIFAHGEENWRNVRRDYRWSLEAATLVLSNSHFTRERMQASVPRVKVEACPLGLSPSFPLRKEPSRWDPGERLELTAADGVPKLLGERVLLLVARMHPDEVRKGHREMIQVLPSLLREHPDVQLVFCGDGGDRPALEALVDEMGVASAVFFPGHVPVEFLDRLYRRAFAFTMPSTQEGFGLVYLEAMNHGRACLGCRNQGSEEVIVHGETGLLVHDPKDLDELAGALRNLLADPARTAALGRRGFERLHAEFTADRFQARVVAELRPLLER